MKRTRPQRPGAVTYRFPKEVNAIYVRNVMCLMDGAIRCGELELLLENSQVSEKRIQWAKRAYSNALRFAGKISFDANDVMAFEARSVKLENLIRQMQVRHHSQNNSSQEARTDSGQSLPE